MIEDIMKEPNPLDPTNKIIDDTKLTQDEGVSDQNVQQQTELERLERTSLTSEPKDDKDEAELEKSLPFERSKVTDYHLNKKLTVGEKKSNSIFKPSWNVNKRK